MASETEAKQWAEDGYKAFFGDEPTLLQRQFLQAIARLETGYGAGWKGAGVGSWNMGAVQSGHAPCNPATSFEYTDTHPNPDGTSTPYTICFRKYPGPVEGMADVARILYKQMAITPTSIEAVSTQMYDKHYYEGFGPTREARIANHVKALTANLKAMTDKLGEPMPPAKDDGADTGPKAPTPPVGSSPSQRLYYLGLSGEQGIAVVASISQGMFNSDAVRLVQSKLKENGLYHGKVDGDFGPLTQAAIQKFLSPRGTPEGEGES